MSAARPERPPTGLAGIRALVVDDNEVNRRVLLAWLERWQMDASVAEDGSAAIAAVAAARDRRQPFEIVLLDLNMPDMDGFEVAERLRGHEGLGGSAVMMLSSSGLFTMTDATA